MNLIQLIAAYPILRLTLYALGLILLAAGFVCWLTDRRNAADREDDL